MTIRSVEKNGSSAGESPSITRSSDEEPSGKQIGAQPTDVHRPVELGRRGLLRL